MSYTNPHTNPFKTLPKDGPMRNTPGNNSRSSSAAYGGTGPGQGTGFSSYRGNRGGGYNNRGGGMNNLSGFNRGGFQQSVNSGFQGSSMGGYQGTSMGNLQSYGGFQGRGAMAGGMRGGAMGMRGGRGGMSTNPMMGMPMGGMGIGAMGMNMPQMAGSIAMQGMTGFLTLCQAVRPLVFRQRARQRTLGPLSSWQGSISLAASSSRKIERLAREQRRILATQTSPIFPQIPFLCSFPNSSIAPTQPSAKLNHASSFLGTQAHFNPAFFPQGQHSGGTGDLSWNPHGVKRTRQE